LAKAEPDCLRAAIVETRLRDPDGIEQFFKIVSEEMQGDPALKADRKPKYPLVIGKKVTHPGVYIGDLEADDNAIRMNLIPDFVRDDFGRIVKRLVGKAQDIIDRFNKLNGLTIRHYTSLEGILCAIDRQNFKDGTLFLADSEALLDIGAQLSSNPELASFRAICAETFSHEDSLCVTNTFCMEGCYRDRRVSECYVRFDKDSAREIWKWDDEAVPGHILVIRGTLAAPAP
jgi:hypothetical protein